MGLRSLFSYKCIHLFELLYIVSNCYKEIFIQINFVSSFLNKCIKEANGPVVACSDYVKLVAEQISPYINCDFTSIGTDGFGRSGTRDELRDFFEIDRYYITLAAMNSLYKQKKINKEKINEVIDKYKIDSEKINPLKC